MEMKRILVGSPVRQKHQILEQFLLGLIEADITGFQVDYYFVDDNVDAESTELLSRFSENHNAVIKKGSELTDLDSYSKYVSDEITHLWDPTTIRKVAFFKDTIIEYALDNKYDYLFFVDSDIVIDKRTLQQLYSRNVEIISNIFWTQWQPNWQLEPQCFWMPALNVQAKKPFSPPISREESRQLQRDFFAKMRIPGIYKVDGLGACTLISYGALEKGVRFKEIPNLSLLGEDRHFCVRAGTLGITLYYDTVYPVYHIYREEYLNRVEEFKREGFKYDMCQTYISVPAAQANRMQEIARVARKAVSYIDRRTFAKIRIRRKPQLSFIKEQTNNSVVLLMTVRDENRKYLSDALMSVKNAIDFAILADVTSNGLTERSFAGILEPDQYKIVSMKNSGNCYPSLWPMAEEYGTKWILSMDADEVLQTGGAEAIRFLVNNVSIDAYYFRRYDMWTAEEYCDGKIGYLPYLMRYQKNYPFTWSASDKLPSEVSKLVHANINLKIRCYRWADEADSQAACPQTMDAALWEEAPALKRYSDLSEEI